jgi:hypothetical protein
MSGASSLCSYNLKATMLISIKNIRKRAQDIKNLNTTALVHDGDGMVTRLCENLGKDIAVSAV